jgi:hypothetical protein
VHFIGTADIMARIRAANGPLPASQPVQALHVLQWVMVNTHQATQAGVLDWARQGMHFATTQGAPDRALLDEALQLQELYDGARSQQAAAGVLKTLVAKQLQRAGGRAALASDMRGMVKNIERLGAQHSEGHTVMSQQGADEECERELELEEEEEEEEEVEVPAFVPRAEVDWIDYKAALRATSAAQLAAVTQVRALHIDTLAAELLPRVLIDWCQSAVV